MSKHSKSEGVPVRPGVEALKQEARRLHRDASRGEPSAIERLRLLPEWRKAEQGRIRAELRRRHGLSAVAIEYGFQGWSHLCAVLEQRSDDLGTLLCPERLSTHWNIWCADHAEARRIQPGTDRVILGYHRQCFLADRHYLEDRGFDPEDPDWERIGFDWVRPADLAARNRLYDVLFQRPSELQVRPLTRSR